MAALNSGSLFDTSVGVADRQTRQRAFVQERLEASGAGGTEADLTTLPPTHAYQGTFGDERTPGTSSEGRAFLALRAAVMAHVIEERGIVHQRSRALT